MGAVAPDLASGGSSSSTAPAELSAPTEASEILRAGKAFLDNGLFSEGVSALLRAERLAASVCDEETRAAAAEALRRTYETHPELIPIQAQRSGSLLLRDPPGPGSRGPEQRADGLPFSAPRSPKEATKWKYEAWICGGEVPRVDCGAAADFQKALDFVRRRVPVVMENLDAMPATSKWSLDYLKRHTTEWPGMNVLRSKKGENRYLYYVPEQSDRDMAPFRGAPRQASTDLRMSFQGFLRSAAEDPSGCYYLQAPLVLRNPDDKGVLRETWSAGIDSTLRADCEQRLNRQRVDSLREAGGFGHWSRSQLFVGPSESLSPVHYDQYDNIYMQVSGEKHFLLFDPRAAEGLYPFPVAHPYDEYAMVDLFKVNHEAFPKAREVLKGRGAAVTLRAGESLYIPTHWWHLVQGAADEGAWSISVNLWFSIFETILQVPHPLPLHLELELARHVELLLSDMASGTSPAGLASLLCQKASSEDGCTAKATNNDVTTVNFVLHSLARILGPCNVKNFVSEQFPPQRFNRDVVTGALSHVHRSK